MTEPAVGAGSVVFLPILFCPCVRRSMTTPPGTHHSFEEGPGLRVLKTSTNSASPSRASSSSTVRPSPSSKKPGREPPEEDTPPSAPSIRSKSSPRLKEEPERRVRAAAPASCRSRINGELPAANVRFECQHPAGRSHENPVRFEKSPCTDPRSNRIIRTPRGTSTEEDEPTTRR